MAQGFGMGKEVVQGIAFGLVAITIFVIIGNRVASGGHDQVEEELQTHGPHAPDAMRRFEVTDAKAKLGAGDFSTCATCHGAEGEGKSGVAPRLNSETLLAAASDTYLFDTIKFGRTGTTMIPFGGNMTDKQIENIVVYLRHTFKSEPAVLNEAPLKGDIETGKKLRTDICAGCHGKSGAGYQETANGTGIGRKGFLEKATNGFIRHIAKHGKTGTSMKPMIGAKTAVSNLTEEEIESVIQYLRDQQW